MATKAIARRRIVYRSASRARSRRKSMTLPIAVIAGLAPMGMDLLSAYKIDGIPAVLSHVSLCTTGYDGVNKWNPMFAVQKLYGPLLLGVVAHKLANKLGVNRMLSSAGVPLLRV